MTRAILLSCAALLASCKLGDKTLFTGYVYNLSTLQKLTGYTIEVQQGGKTTSGKIAGDGKYSVEVGSDHDFNVVIKMAGYRDFVSAANFAGASGAPATDPEQVTRNAFLIPTDPSVGDITVNVAVIGSAERPASGKLRVSLVGIGGGANPDIAFDGSNNNVWGPDAWPNTGVWETSVFEFDVVNGVATIPAGTLIFGANYRTAVHSVPGVDVYFPGAGGSFRAGFSGSSSQAVTLRLYPADFALAAISASNAFSDITPSGDLTITYNAPIEFDPQYVPTYYPELVDRGISTYPAYTLKTAIAANTQIGGVRIEGDRLIFSWVGAAQAVEMAVPANAQPISAVNYPVGAVLIRAVGRSEPPVAANMGGSISGRVNFAAETFPPPP